METIFSFLVNASAGIILFYLCYWFLLRKETFYTANRWFLLLALLTAVLLPLFPIHYTVFVEQSTNKTTFQTITDTFKNIPVYASNAKPNKTISWQQIVLIIYLTGAVIFLLRLITQTVILFHLMLKYKLKSLNGLRIVENEKYGLPFSFFNVIFINPKFHTQDELPEILAHEKVHIRENHWFDLLFIELLTVIFWFNPFIWLFERSIKQNHEYLADKGVLAQGHTVSKYQAILVNQLMGMQIIGITNNLNFALSTNRLKMMTKKKTSAKRMIRFSLTLPVPAILLYAFAQPNYQAKDVEKNESGISIHKTVSKKKLTINGKVVMKETGEPIPGASIVIKGTTIGTVSDRDGTFKLVDPNPETNSTGGLSSKLVVSFVGLKTMEIGVAASGSGIDKAKYTFLMEDAVIDLSDLNVPPPPPPPTAPPKEKLVKNKPVKDVPPPPPPTSEKGEKEVFYIVEDMPAYPGGFFALNEYVQKMQKKIAEQKKVSGKAKVQFTVNAKGKISDIKIVEQDNDGAAKGAYMLANEMPDWKPGKQRGKAVPVKYLLPVEFK